MNPAHNLVKNIAEKITLPEVYHYIHSLMQNPDAKIDDFVQVISLDSTLAARIIRIANSRFFGYSRKALTIKQAITLIGVIQLHDLLLSSLAIRAFLSIPEDVVNQKTFWRSSIYCGVTARLLAKKCMLPTSERLFTSALLHEIGHLVMYAEMPSMVEEVLFQADQTKQPIYQVEREVLGYDYGQVGSEVMRLWHLPDCYSDTARYHMEPEKASNDHIEIQIINLARSIMLADELGFEQPDNLLMTEETSLINKTLSVNDIEKIANQGQLYVDEVMDCLWPLSRKVAEEQVILI